MKKWGKIFAAAIGVFIVFLIGTYFLVKSIVLPETVKSLIIPRLEEMIKHPVSCRRINVGFNGTIALKEVAVGNGQPREEGVWLTAHDMLLHCRIVPLLFKKIIIERITLREPHCKLVRDESGKFNVWSPEALHTNRTDSGSDDRKGGGSEPALRMNIRTLAFEDGTLIFTDYSKHTPAPLQTAVKNISGSFSDLSLVSPFDFNLAAEIVSASPAAARLKGSIDPLRKIITSEVKLAPFDITRLVPYLPPFPFTIEGGSCSLDVTLTASSTRDISSRGMIRLSNAAVSYAGGSDQAFSAALARMISGDEISLDHQCSYRAADDTLILEKCTLTFRKIGIALRGKIEDWRTERRCDITVDMDRISGADLFNALQLNQLPAAQHFFSSGLLSARFSVKGGLQRPGEQDMSGIVLMDKLAVRSDIPPRFDLEMDGSAELKQQDVVIKGLTARTGASSLTVNGSLANCFSGPLAAQLRLNSPSIDAEEVMGCLTQLRMLKRQWEEEAKGGERNKKKQTDNYSKMTIDADAVIDRFIYRSLAVSELEANSRLNGRKFVLESLRGVMGDGAFSASGIISSDEASGIDCTCRITGNRLQLGQIIKSIFPERKEEVSGMADLALNMQGRGTTAESFKKNLTGEGNFIVRDGTIAGLQSLESVASFLKMDSLKTLSFDESRGTFAIANGAIRLESSLKGKDVELYPAGIIGLDSAIDMVLDMRLAPQLSDQIADGVLTKYFKDEKGWTMLSLAIKAPAGGDVMILPASSTIKNITEMLADILLKKEGTPADERQDKKKALEDLLQKLMQKSKDAGAGEGVQPPSE